MKVKIKSLAEEARIIRKEEHHAPEDDTRERLYLHRINVVRVEARAALLLYVYAKYQHEEGKGRCPSRWRYSNIERNVDPHCYWRSQALRKAKDMGKRFNVAVSKFDEWVNM